MKHKIILNALILFVTTICGAQSNLKGSPKNDLEKLRLKGKIKHIETTMYKIVDRFGEIIKTEMIKPVCGAYFFAYSPSQSSLFDERGNIMVTDNYDSNGDLERKTIYKYDNRGNKIKSSYYSGGDESTSPSLSLYKYDYNGNMIEYIYYNSKGDLVNKSVSVFNEEGNITENFRIRQELQFRIGGIDCKGEYKAIYKYDNRGNEIEVIVYRDGVPEYLSESKIVYYD